MILDYMRSIYGKFSGELILSALVKEQLSADEVAEIANEAAKQGITIRFSEVCCEWEESEA